MPAETSDNRFSARLTLIVCLMVVRRPGGLNDAGFAWYLIIAFLLGLLLETVMSVGYLKSL